MPDQNPSQGSQARPDRPISSVGDLLAVVKHELSRAAPDHGITSVEFVDAADHTSGLRVTGAGTVPFTLTAEEG